MDPDIQQPQINGLIDATTSRNVPQVEVLMQAGADPCIPTTDGTSPIHKAALLESPAGPCIMSTMLNYGADPNTRTMSGLSPLHIAAMWGRVETINVLIDSGADVTLKDHDDMSPLDYAEQAEDCRYESIDALTRYRIGREETDSGCEIYGCYYETRAVELNLSPPYNKNITKIDRWPYLGNCSDSSCNYYIEAEKNVNSNYFYKNYYGDPRNNPNANYQSKYVGNENHNGDPRNYYWNMEANLGGSYYGTNSNGSYVKKGNNINRSYYWNIKGGNNYGHYYQDDENNNVHTYGYNNQNYYWNNVDCHSYPPMYKDQGKRCAKTEVCDKDKRQDRLKCYLVNYPNQNYETKENGCYRADQMNKGVANGDYIGEEIGVDDYYMKYGNQSDNCSYLGKKDLNRGNEDKKDPSIRCNEDAISHKESIGGSTISEITDVSDSDEDHETSDNESTNDSFWSVSSVPNIEELTTMDTLIRKLDKELVLEERLIVTPPIIKCNEAIAVVCGLQELYRSKLENFDSLCNISQRLLSALSLLDVPLIVTEDVNISGSTVNEIDVSQGTVLRRTSFSAVNTELKNYLSSMKNNRTISNVILFGLEAHICIQLTALDLINEGYCVHIVADATFSKSQDDRMFAFYRIRQSGGIVTTFESIMNALLTDREHPKYATVNKLIIKGPSSTE